MFFQMLIYIVILISGAWILWKYVIQPLLQGTGVIEEEEDPIKTEYTKKLEKLKDELAEKEVSSEAIGECVSIKAQIKELERQIAEKAVDLK
jgi:Tfp pilus assembly protein PilO